MSYVTNLMIAFNCGEAEEKVMELLLKEFTDKIETAPFLNFDNCAVGGNKNYEAVLFMAAFNYLDYDEFVNFIHSLKEKLKANKVDDYYYEEMQVFIKNQDDEIWKVVMANELNKNDF